MAKKADAERIATGLVEARLAACVQIDGPIQSCYIWENRTEWSDEFRLTIKFIPARGREVEAWVMHHHPYAVPEWVVLRSEQVGEKYLSWARANSTSAPL